MQQSQTNPIRDSIQNNVNCSLTAVIVRRIECVKNMRMQIE